LVRGPVIASEAKQSILPAQHGGLLRFAKNDGKTVSAEARPSGYAGHASPFGLARLRHA